MNASGVASAGPSSRYTISSFHSRVFFHRTREKNFAYLSVGSSSRLVETALDSPSGVWLAAARRKFTCGTRKLLPRE